MQRSACVPHRARLQSQSVEHGVRRERRIKAGERIGELRSPSVAAWSQSQNAPLWTAQVTRLRDLLCRGLQWPIGCSARRGLLRLATRKHLLRTSAHRNVGSNPSSGSELIQRYTAESRAVSFNAQGAEEPCVVDCKSRHWKLVLRQCNGCALPCKDATAPMHRVWAQFLRPRTYCKLTYKNDVHHAVTRSP